MIITVEQARLLAHAATQAVGHTDAEAETISDHLIDWDYPGSVDTADAFA